jgi:tight adherence protein B
MAGGSAVSGVTLALLGVVVVVAPLPSWAAVRLRRISGRSRRSPAPSAAIGARRLGLGLAALGGAGGAWLPVVVGRGGPAVLPAVAGAVAGGVVGVVVAAEVGRRRQDSELRATAEALVGLGDELRAGQRPGVALAAAAGAVGHPRVATVLADAAVVAGTGGDVPGALRDGPVRFGLLAAAWVVSERSGASLAEIVGRLEADVRAAQGQRQQAMAHLAGSRATMAMLAALPGLGLGLAGGIGADPVGVLLGTGAGQTALLGGVILDAVGVLWSMRILRVAGSSP